MGKQKDPRMADARYVAAMLANGAKYARYDALDTLITKHANEDAEMVITAMAHYPEMEVRDWDSLNAVVEKDGDRFKYDRWPKTKADKAMRYRVIMGYVDEMRRNGFVANEHLMTEDFWETSAMVPM